MIIVAFITVGSAVALGVLAWIVWGVMKVSKGEEFDE